MSFTLRHPEGSPEESSFLAAAGALSAIDGIEAFELLRQVGTKSGFRFGISMEFADRAAYDGYNEPSGTRAVRRRTLGAGGGRFPRARLLGANRDVSAGRSG